MESLKTSRIILFLLALGIATRWAALFFFHIHLVIHFEELEKIARSLALDGVFGNPYRIPTGPTAHCAPIYPVLLSLVFRALGYGSKAAYAMAAINIFFALLQYALLPVLTDTARIHRLIGLTAGFLGAVLPYQFLTETRSEATLAALLIVIVTIVTVSWWQNREPSAPRAFLVGVAWGIAMLCSPVLLPVFLLVLLFSRSMRDARNIRVGRLACLPQPRE